MTDDQPPPDPQLIVVYEVEGEQEQRQPLYLRDVRMVSRVRDVKR
jgi:hypothetical protein